MSAHAQIDALPTVTPWLLTWFRGYARRYLQRHFTALRQLRRCAPPPDDGQPLVVYLNHPSWWDPLVAMTLAYRYWPHRVACGPMDAEALNRYGLFRRLGYFPVALGTAAGARVFLQTAEAILARDDRALWLTPQGVFTDVRPRPLVFRAGLAHVARRMTHGWLVPLAVEYTFWTERLPEALIAWGEPVSAEQVAATETQAVEEVLIHRLTTAQEALAEAAVAREPQRFEVLLQGRVGVGGVYDHWRRWAARTRGRRFEAAHGQPRDQDQP